MSDLEIRPATIEDVPAIVAMLADDPLGATREGDPGDLGYQMAFLEIAADPQQKLVVGVFGGEVVATLQLTIIPGLSRKGSKRALIEAVRVRSDQRGAGLGRRIIGWAIAEARANNCVMVQLTTDKSRVDAHRFYESLGFESSHLGMKLSL
ncbi:GNAT family acetyltransferase [Rhizocola hellebori]|uniref:GNAT family acetyltransferase n=1 Tax=Rhizocola hellebori TaxID=1392758 RepID=A0A8J3QBI5_9ACTN|nr:GNAT family N-acetyltransferase [Rhizocola hellebori]GIH07531.1 GNAT family acetyltransferase [Rhizocola hellebori]